MQDSCIIGGLGRCGTTLLYESLKSFYICEDIFIINLMDLIPKEKYLYKTHDFAPQKEINHSKIIFLFGNPIDIVLSYMYMIDNKFSDPILICKHLHSNHEKLQNWLDEDVFRLEENFDSWNQENDFEFLSLRYESLYDNINVVNNFLGLSINLPPWKKRRTSCTSSKYFSKLSETYSSLINKVNKSEDYKIHKKKSINATSTEP